MNEEKAEVIENFVDTMIGALESGFVDKGNVNLSEVYSYMRWHVKENYDIELQTLREKWGDDVAKICGEKSIKD